MTRTYSGDIYFKATTTGHTVTTNGKTLANMIYFSGISGGWTLQDNLTNNSSNYIYLQNGTLDLNGKTVSTGRFNIYGTSTRTLTMGAASVYCTSANYASWNAQTTTNLTFNVGTSYIKSRGMEGGGLTYYNFEAYYSGGSLTIYGANTYHDLTITGFDEESWSGDDNATINSNVTVTNDFTITGYSQQSCIALDSGDYDDQTTITCNGTVSITDASFYGIIGAGSASWTGTRVGDCGNNSGITFTTATNKYWVGNGGYWNDTAHWSTSSGGGSGATIPLPQDTAYFDSSSFSTTAQTVYLRKVILPEISMSGVTDSPTFDGDEDYYNYIYGDLTLCSGITFTPEYFTFSGASDTTLNTAGITIDATKVVLVGKKVGSKLTLNSHLTVDYSADIGFEALNGTLDLNNYNVTCYRYNTNYSTETPTLYMGDGTMTIKGTGFVFSKPDGTLYSEESTIIIDDTSATLKTFSGYDETYNNLTITGDNVKITGSNTFHTLTLNNDGLTNGTLFEAGETQTINTFYARGTSGNLVVIQSTSSGSAATISKSSGVVSCDYLSVKDSTATGGASWYAGANSTSVSGNSGWTFTGAPGRYWVTGGTGDWSDTDNWSTSSGGSSGASVPTSSDDVFFDENSGAGTATVNTSAADCKDLGFAGFTGTFTGTTDFDIYGSLTVVAGMTWSFGYDIFFKATDARTITTNGQTLNCEFQFDGIGGSWTLQDHLDLGNVGNSYFDLNHGTVDLNDFNVTCSYFYADGSNARTLSMGTGTVSVKYRWDASSGTNLTLNAETSTVSFISTTSTQTLYNGGKTLYDVEFLGAYRLYIMDATSCHDLTVTGIAQDDVLIYIRETQTITGTLTINGSSLDQQILVEEYGRDSTATLNCAIVSFSNVVFTDMTAAGAAAPFTATGCGDGGHNTNFTFDAAKNRYWIGDSGQWNATAEWSASSGGAGGASVPLAHDTAIFDANSFSAPGHSVSMNQNVLSAVTFADATNSPTFTLNPANTRANSFGNITFASGMSMDGNGNEWYIRANCTLTTAGVTLADSRVYISAHELDTVTLVGNLTITGRALLIYDGTFDANDYDVAVDSIYCSGDEMLMGSGTWTVQNGASMFYSGGTVTPETSTLVFAEATTDVYVYNTSLSFNNVTINVDNVRFLNNGGTMNTLTINNAGGAIGTIFEATKTWTVNDFITNGSTGNLVKILSDASGTPFTLSKSSGTVEEEYMDIKDSTATGGATWIARSSVNSGGNTGWTFEYTNTIEAKGNIFNTVTQTVDSKGDIKQTGITKTVTAKGKIMFTYENTITAKGRIEKTETQTIDAKGNIEVTTEQTITAKARIETTEDQTIQAKGNVKVTTEQTITSKGNIEVTTTQTAQAKGDIKQLGVTKTIGAKARIVNTYSSTISAKGDVKVLGETKTTEAKGDILHIRTNTIDSKGLIKALGVTKTIGAKARVRFFYTQTIEAKASIKNTRKRVDAKGRIITDWQIPQPKLGTTILPFPNKASVKRVRHKGEKDTIAGKKKQDNMGEKYQYRMSWHVIRPPDFVALEEEIKTGEPVTFTYEKWPQSSGLGVAVLGKMSPRKYVGGTGTTDFLSNVSVTLTEAEPR
jgi:hypothetical protein